MRTTAVAVMAEGVQGDPSAWTNASGGAFSPLEDTLQKLPATRQERLFARLYLTLPVIIGLLSVFWAVSGLVGFWRMEAATEVLRCLLYTSPSPRDS